MTQASSSQPLLLNLLPMRLPEADPSLLPIPSAASDALKTDSTKNLLLVPGEPSEMLVKLENAGNRTLELELLLTGNFPNEWYRLGTEGDQLLPGERQEALLYFQIPADFFEAPQTLHSSEVLKLDYYGRLDVYAAYPGTTQRLTASAEFNLYIRPHSLYLNYLPQIYREVDFVGRFLKIFEEAFEPDVQTLDNLWSYLDPLTAPSEMLSFLAHWVGWQIQPYLTLERQRHLIRNAIEIYRWRGTRRGLRLHLHLATNLPLDEDLPNEEHKHIGIFESFSRGFVLGGTHIGQDATLGGGRPFHFSVRLRPVPHYQINEQLVRTVIEQEKPAFCTYDLHLESLST